MMLKDCDLGMLVLVGHAHWKAASWVHIAGAWLLGQHVVFTHLGRQARISFFCEKPYLLTFRDCR